MVDHVKYLVYDDHFMLNMVDHVDYVLSHEHDEEFGIAAARRGSMPTASSLQRRPPAIPGDAGTKSKFTREMLGKCCETGDLTS